jgi:predicted metal-binding membrane protein
MYPHRAINGTLIERLVRRERTVLVMMLVILPLLCWSWLVPMARDMSGSMSGASAWMMTAEWDGPHLALLAAMWIAMMIGMMLPSAAPMLLLYAAAARGRSGGSRSGWRVYSMAAGYLLVWIAFSLFATLLQRILTTLLLLSPMMESRSPLVSGVLLMGAGIYQMTPLKRTCLVSCSAPMVFLMRRWREGPGGAFALGIEHGLFCVGCCWALMLLLFAGGVMNLAVIAALTAVVLIEKLAPGNLVLVRVIGILLIIGGLWVMVQ